MGYNEKIYLRADEVDEVIRQFKEMNANRLAPNITFGKADSTKYQVVAFDTNESNWQGSARYLQAQPIDSDEVLKSLLKEFVGVSEVGYPIRNKDGKLSRVKEGFIDFQGAYRIYNLIINMFNQAVDKSKQLIQPCDVYSHLQFTARMLKYMKQTGDLERVCYNIESFCRDDFGRVTPECRNKAFFVATCMTHVDEMNAYRILSKLDNDGYLALNEFTRNKIQNYLKTHSIEPVISVSGLPGSDITDEYGRVL